MPEHMLEINALKIQILYGKELIKTAASGTVCTYMHAFLLGVARAWHGDTQGVEGLNGSLKTEIRKAPHISLPLLSTRLGVKHLIGSTMANGNSISKKWSDLKPVVDSLLSV